MYRLIINVSVEHVAPSSSNLEDGGITFPQNVSNVMLEYTPYRSLNYFIRRVLDIPNCTSMMFSASRK
jgi:hypothetical protein